MTVLGFDTSLPSTTACVIRPGADPVATPLREQFSEGVTHRRRLERRGDLQQPAVLPVRPDQLDADGEAVDWSAVSALVPVRVRCTNIGNTLWLASPSGSGQVMLGAHLLDEQRRLLALDHARAPLPRSVRPGEAIEVAMTLPAPATPGRYLIEVDLVAEGMAWFGSLGSPTAGFPLEVGNVEG